MDFPQSLAERVAQSHRVRFHECGRLHLKIVRSDNSMVAKIFHSLLALIASASNNELARYVGFLKEENKILWSCRSRSDSYQADE